MVKSAFLSGCQEMVLSPYPPPLTPVVQKVSLMGSRPCQALCVSVCVVHWGFSLLP